MHRKTADTLKLEFIENAAEITSKAHHVRINETALKNFAQDLKKPTKAGPSWDDYLGPQDNTLFLPDLVHEMIVITAQNAGYLYEDAKGEPQKWNVDGSGAKALLGLFNTLRDKKLLRGKDDRSLNISDDHLRKLKEALSGIPYADERLEIFKETLGSEAFGHIYTMTMRSLQIGGGFKFDMQSVETLAKAFPKAFGDDPYRKKAMLALIMVAGNARSRGVNIDLDLPAPTDYRLPETLNTAGVLEFSPELTERINKAELMDENDPVVTELRAATLVAVEKLCDQSGLKIDEVDFALWNASRDGTLDRLRQEYPNAAKQHFRCKTMWF